MKTKRTPSTYTGRESRRVYPPARGRLEVLQSLARTLHSAVGITDRSAPLPRRGSRCGRPPGAHSPRLPLPLRIVFQRRVALLHFLRAGGEGLHLIVRRVGIAPRVLQRALRVVQRFPQLRLSRAALGELPTRIFLLVVLPRCRLRLRLANGMTRVGVDPRSGRSPDRGTSAASASKPGGSTSAIKRPGFGAPGDSPYVASASSVVVMRRIVSRELA